MDVVGTRTLPEKPMTIGVRGRAGAGKDTFADMLAEILRERGLEVRREAFATPVCECLEVLTGMPAAESQTRDGMATEIPGWGHTARELLREIRAGATRAHPDAWVLALLRRLDEGKIVIISDVCSPNEIRAVRDREGIIISIDRDDAPGGAPAPAGRSPESQARGAARDDAIRAITRLYELGSSGRASEAPVATGGAASVAAPDIILDNSKSLEDLRRLAKAVAGRLYGHEG